MKKSLFILSLSLIIFCSCQKANVTPFHSETSEVSERLINPALWFGFEVTIKPESPILAGVQYWIPYATSEHRFLVTAESSTHIQVNYITQHWFSKSDFNRVY